MKLGKLIGTGFRRAVYEHPDDPTLVIKILKDPDDDHNQIEWENWQKLKGTDKAKWLAPCVELTNEGSVLVQKKVEIVETPEDVPEWIKILRDWSIGGNQTLPWGMFEGRPVIVDYGDEPLWRYLTEMEFSRQVEALKGALPEHWGRDEGKPGQPRSKDRWAYHKATVDILRDIKPKTILEAGTMGIQVANDSDTIDLDMPEWNWTLTYKPTYNQDLRLMPWPIVTQYDVFIALRVFHHMDEEVRYLKEMMRVSKHIILALTTASAERYEAVRPATKKIMCEETDTVVLYYKS